MRLVLTSSGIVPGPVASRLEGLVGAPGDVRVAIVTSATPQSEAWRFVDEARDDLLSCGFKTIDVHTLEKPFTPKAFDKYGMVYCCGGNTFTIRAMMRRTGFDTAIRRFVDRDGIYVGVSAGSIIAGPDIRIAGWGSEGDPNDDNLADLKGLGFCDIAIFPHHRPALADEVASFRKTADYEVVPLADGQALFLWDGRRERI